jgi:hypothetical protein
MEINEKEKSSSAEEVRKSDVTTDNETTAKKESDSDAGDTPDIPVTDEKQAGTEVTEI